MQQPPNPYPQFQQPSPQQWQQPTMPPQQSPLPPQQYQQPPQYQPPNKKSRKRLWLILAAVVLVLAVIIDIAAQGQSHQQAPTTQDTQQPTLQPTNAPTTELTPKPTVQPTQGLAATHGTPHLGGPISDFIGAYGQPGPHSNIQPGLNDFHFLPSTSSNSNVDGLIVDTDPSSTALAANITVQAQNGNAQTSAVGWAVNDAKKRCMTFAPSDARFVKEFVYANNSGFDMVYTSAQLARNFPASAFTNGQGNQVQAGMFDVSYLYAGDNQHIDSCDMIIGEQQTTN